MEVKYKAPGAFKMVNSLVKVENEQLYCNRVKNALFYDTEAKNYFNNDGIIIEKVWIKDFNIKLSQLKNVIVVGHTKTLASLIMAIVICLGLTAFSYFTGSLFLFNGIIYLFVFILFIFFYIKGNTTIKLFVNPVSVDKTYMFEIVAYGNSSELINFGNELKKMTI